MKVMSTSRSGRFTPTTHSLIGWVSITVGLDAVQKIKILALLINSRLTFCPLTPRSRVLFEKLIITQPFHYYVHKSLPPDSILSQINPVHNFPPCALRSIFLCLGHRKESVQIRDSVCLITSVFFTARSC
jgi:hypothetical protein